MSFLDTLNVKAPCYDCQERHKLCWNDCPKYAEYVKKYDKIREGRKQLNQRFQMTRSRDRAERRELRKGRQWRRPWM